MLIAKITGSLVATEKVVSMVGNKLLLVEPLDEESRLGLDQDDLRLRISPLDGGSGLDEPVEGEVELMAVGDGDQRKANGGGSRDGRGRPGRQRRGAGGANACG